MNVTQKVNYPTSLGTSESTDGPRWNYMCLGIIPLWTFVTNGIVLIAFYKDKSLRNNLANVIIASLTMADFFLSTLVLPLAVYYKVNDHWELGFALKLLWFCLDVFFSAGSIMNLCVISVYRYLAIAYPYRIRYGMSRGHVSLLLGVAWGLSCLASLAVMTESLIWNSKGVVLDEGFNRSNLVNDSDLLQPLPPTTFQTISSADRRANGSGETFIKLILPTVSPPVIPEASDTSSHSTVSDSYFQGAKPFLIYGSILTFFLPLAIMTFTAIRSIQLLKRQSTFSDTLHRRSVAAINLHANEPLEDEDEDDEDPRDNQNIDDSKSQEDEERGTVGMSERGRNSQIRFILTPPPHRNGICRSDSPHRRISQCQCPENKSASSSSSCSSEIVTVPPGRSKRSMSVPISSNLLRGKQRSIRASTSKYEEGSQLHVYRKSDSDKNEDSKQINNRQRYRRRLTLIFTGHRPSVFSVHSKEQRAIRTLLMVFIVFAVCWSPFFVMQLIVAFSPPNQTFNRILFDLAWPGFASSGLNPVIYTIFNPEYKVSVMALLAEWRRNVHSCCKR